MITLDASVIIAHLSSRDIHHETATSYLRDRVDHQLLIHPVTLAEVLVGGVRVGRGQELLDDLTALGVSVAGRTEGESLRLATLRVETGLKLPDCWVLDTALTHESELATFDQDLADAARTRRVRVGPYV